MSKQYGWKSGPQVPSGPRPPPQPQGQPEAWLVHATGPPPRTRASSSPTPTPHPHLALGLCFSPQPRLAVLSVSCGRALCRGQGGRTGGISPSSRPSRLPGTCRCFQSYTLQTASLHGALRVMTEAAPAVRALGLQHTPRARTPSPGKVTSLQHGLH